MDISHTIVRRTSKCVKQRSERNSLESFADQSWDEIEILKFEIEIEIETDFLKFSKVEIEISSQLWWLLKFLMVVE